MEHNDHTAALLVAVDGAAGWDLDANGVIEKAQGGGRWERGEKARRDGRLRRRVSISWVLLHRSPRLCALSQR
jgi:hypothetical protein